MLVSMQLKVCLRNLLLDHLCHNQYLMMLVLMLLRPTPPKMSQSNFGEVVVVDHLCRSQYPMILAMALVLVQLMLTRKKRMTTMMKMSQSNFDDVVDIVLVVA